MPDSHDRTPDTDFVDLSVDEPDDTVDHAPESSATGPDVDATSAALATGKDEVDEIAQWRANLDPAPAPLRQPKKIALIWLPTYLIYDLITTFGVFPTRFGYYVIAALIAWLLFRRSVPWKPAQLAALACATGLVDMLVSDIFRYLVLFEVQRFSGTQFNVNVPRFIAAVGIIAIAYCTAALTNTALRDQISHVIGDAKKGRALPAAVTLALLLAAGIFTPIRALTGTWEFTPYDWRSVDNYTPNGHRALNQMEKISLPQLLLDNAMPAENVDCVGWTLYEDEDLITYRCFVTFYLTADNPHEILFTYDRRNDEFTCEDISTFDDKVC